jgi:BMFP domain-containing protein YqiC
MRRAIGQRESEVSEWLNESRDDVESNVQHLVERVLGALDLPRRADIDALNANLERVAKALENLEGSSTD